MYRTGMKMPNNQLEIDARRMWEPSVICCLDVEIQPGKVRFLRFVAWFLVLRSEVPSFFWISEAALLVFHVRHVTRGGFPIPDGERGITELSFCDRCEKFRYIAEQGKFSSRVCCSISQGTGFGYGVCGCWENKVWCWKGLEEGSDT
jgi:hypothetical protein